MREYMKSVFSKQNILNNIKLKVFSIVLAVIVWFVVVNITDPVKNQPYRNVKVQFVNTEVLTENGKTYEVLDGTDIISNVTVRASVNTIHDLGTTADCIIAVADFARMSPDGKSVPIEITTSKYSEKVERIRSSQDTLSIKVENKKSIQIPIQSSAIGDIENGYILGNISPAQNQVKISGPESVIDRIKAARVEVQISGFTEDISTQAEIVLYDENGDALPKKNLTLNVDNVTVVAEILATKKVPVYYATIGTPAEGYSLTGEIECSPEIVTIAGPSTDIANITEINIPASELNVTGQDDTMLVMVDLNKFLPENIRFADPSFNGKASFKIYIEPLIEDNFGIDVHEISVNGAFEGFEVSLDQGETYEMTLTGLAQHLEKIQLDSLTYLVDVEKYINDNFAEGPVAGTYDIPLTIDLPDGVALKDEVFVKVILSQE